MIALRRPIQDSCGGNHAINQQHLLAPSELVLARKDQELLDVIFTGLDAILIRTTREQRQLHEKLDIKPVREPPGIRIIRCDACALELPQLYVRCEICLRLNKNDKRHVKRQREEVSDDSAIFFCADCAVEHYKQYKNHRMVALLKNPFSQLRRLVARFDHLRQAASLPQHQAMHTNDDHSFLLSESVLQDEITPLSDKDKTKQNSNQQVPYSISTPSPTSAPSDTFDAFAPTPAISQEHHDQTFDDMSIANFSAFENNSNFFPIVAQPISSQQYQQHFASARFSVYPLQIVPSPANIHNIPSWYGQPITPASLSHFAFQEMTRPNRMISFQQFYYQQNHNPSAPPPLQPPQPPFFPQGPCPFPFFASTDESTTDLHPFTPPSNASLW
eukprot:CAMPEP_0197311284 /NCGR_PEP_ID=MMETSP0891-20130614/9778_1 /TAXON_ID=44058 ORGANISM="Aureoumbra lagunensis, Strain CCMP1510" /NCGR_SAMPLE_ID=MMETSP0891 /ASSEMBLY_ACC=CAM_ASM_000534 /LENGTH=387 /DNA_ID=CAMNT_0042797327 /DNA_START=1244 /DNA_END=2404 /DNA_ORIENTATION=+